MGNGKRLKEILDEKNIRVSELAKLTNMNQQTLYSIINRDYNIRFDFAFRIANALDIDVSEICDTDLYITADTLLKFQMAKTEKGESMKIKDEEINKIKNDIEMYKKTLNLMNELIDCADQFKNTDQLIQDDFDCEDFLYDKQIELEEKLKSLEDKSFKR